MQAGNNNMSDFCNCASCPHHCGDEEQDDDIKSVLDDDAAKAATADKNVKKLKSDIEKLGFNVEDTKDGMKVSS